MSIRKVKRGENLSISARDWNKIADSVNVFGNQRTPGASQLGPEYVWVKNTLGRDLGRWAAVMIGKPTPDELATGKNDQVYTLLNPSMQGQQGNGEPIVGILPGPIASNRLGIVQINGVTPALFRWDEAGGTATGDYACISDLDDMLTFSNGGPVRVLTKFTVNESNSTKGWMVELGTAPSMVSVNWLSEEITWGALGSNYGNIWDAGTRWGDAVRCGLYQVGTTSELRLSRLGRWLVHFDWKATFSGSYSNTDTLVWRIVWDGNLDGLAGAEYGRADGTWISGGGLGYAITGGRSFSFNITNSTSQTLHIPQIDGKKITSGGTVTTETLTGRIRIRVQRIGSPAFTTEWSETKRDAAWARGSSAGPI